VLRHSLDPPPSRYADDFTAPIMSFQSAQKSGRSFVGERQAFPKDETKQKHETDVNTQQRTYECQLFSVLRGRLWELLTATSTNERWYGCD
jgi:hypothetical protein